MNIETPSGKGAHDENFPVGSFLLPKALRPHVARYYRFARAIDDIADNPDLEPEDKLARLDRFAAALEGRAPKDPALETAHALGRSMAETKVTIKHGLDLIHAFKRDAVKNRTKDWPDLIDYCNYSANPVGRFLLDLNGEDKSGYAAADALCSALQILNHLQDCQDDYRNLDRVYLPDSWLLEEGSGVDDLAAPSASQGLHRVIQRCLDGVDALLDRAAFLAPQLRSLGLAMESQVIYRLARRLSGKLRRGDPLASRVGLTKLDFLTCGVSGPVEIMVRRIFHRRTKVNVLTGREPQ
ncbi:MAG: squalene synthase HpnC [Kiloniellales bacterium]|nr:squalene synthase HpnC [Kiloniellales bacterium]